MSELIDAAKEAAFALETVAHLQGREQTLLPIAERLRRAIKDRETSARITDVGTLDTEASRRRAMGFPKKVEDGATALDEICTCGALRCQHEDTFQMGHGACPQMHCEKFTFHRWLLA